jgi:hypothetical protein
MSALLALTAPGDFEIYKSFNSISKISKIKQSSLDTSVQEIAVIQANLTQSALQ